MNSLEIKESRKRLGITQSALANKLGVSLKTVANYECGGVIPESKKILLNKVLLVKNSPKNKVENKEEDSLLHRYEAAHLSFLKVKNKWMSYLAGSGFLKLYIQKYEASRNPEGSFEYCNNQYMLVFGQLRYDDYEHFLKANFLKTSDSDIMQRDYLLSFFKEVGFDSWESFSPLILHYYPQITVEKLYLFYQCRFLDKNTLKLVDFVRQIIGK